MKKYLVPIATAAYLAIAPIADANIDYSKRYQKGYSENRMQRDPIINITNPARISTPPLELIIKVPFIGEVKIKLPVKESNKQEELEKIDVLNYEE